MKVCLDYVNVLRGEVFSRILDGHPNIITIPFEVYDYAAPILIKKEIIAENLWDRLAWVFNYYFPNEVIPYDKQKFISYLNEYFAEYGVSNKTAFVALYYAYARISGRIFSGKLYIAYQSHMHIKRFWLLYKDFSTRMKTIFLIRDPRSTFSAQQNNLVNAWLTFFYSVLTYNFLCKSLITFDTQKILILTHENIHLRYVLVRKQLTSFLDISDNTSLNTSTYFGKYYTGANMSYKSKTGYTSATPSKKFVHDGWRSSISVTQVKLMRKIGRQLFVDNGYDISLLPHKDAEPPSLTLFTLFGFKKVVGRLFWLLENIFYTRKIVSAVKKKA